MDLGTIHFSAVFILFGPDILLRT